MMVWFWADSYGRRSPPKPSGGGAQRGSDGCGEFPLDVPCYGCGPGPGPGPGSSGEARPMPLGPALWRRGEAEADYTDGCSLGGGTQGTLGNTIMSPHSGRPIFLVPGKMYIKDPQLSTTGMEWSDKRELS